MDGVDLAVEGDVDLAVEGGDDVGELVAAAGAQVDGAFEGLFEQRGFGLGEADHRAGWALSPGLACGELDPGAGALDVGVVEELGVGQGDRGAGDVGFAGAGSVRVGVRAGLPARLVEPERLMASLGAKGRVAQLATWKWSLRVGDGAFGRRRLRR